MIHNVIEAHECLRKLGRALEGYRPVDHVEHPAVCHGKTLPPRQGAGYSTWIADAADSGGAEAGLLQETGSQNGRNWPMRGSLRIESGRAGV